MLENGRSSLSYGQGLGPRCAALFSKGRPCFRVVFQGKQSREILKVPGEKSQLMLSLTLYSIRDRRAAAISHGILNISIIGFIEISQSILGHGRGNTLSFSVL